MYRPTLVSAVGAPPELFALAGHPLRWRLLSELGRGGMASVHRARHVESGRAAAVKVMFPGLALDAEIGRAHV